MKKACFIAFSFLNNPLPLFHPNLPVVQSQLTYIEPLKSETSQQSLLRAVAFPRVFSRHVPPLLCSRAHGEELRGGKDWQNYCTNFQHPRWSHCSPILWHLFLPPLPQALSQILMAPRTDVGGRVRLLAGATPENTTNNDESPPPALTICFLNPEEKGNKTIFRRCWHFYWSEPPNVTKDRGLALLSQVQNKSSASPNGLLYRKFGAAVASAPSLQDTVP